MRLQVAADEHFRHVVLEQDIPTSRAVNRSVKARLSGLRAHQRYWYRFETRRSPSKTGRLQTALPPDSHEPVRFAAFSCADYTHGFYNAYDVMADDDLDFVVGLGDYIHAEVYNTVAAGTAVRDDPIGVRNPHQPSVARQAGDTGRLPSEVHAVSLRPGTAANAPDAADDRCLGRPRGAEQLRRGCRGTATAVGLRDSIWTRLSGRVTPLT